MRTTSLRGGGAGPAARDTESHGHHRQSQLLSSRAMVTVITMTGRHFRLVAQITVSCKLTRNPGPPAASDSTAGPLGPETDDADLNFTLEVP